MGERGETLIPMKVTLDVSLTAAWVLKDENQTKSLGILEKILNGTLMLVQPELWWVETLNLLKTATLRKRITPKTAIEAVRSLKEIPMRVIPVSLVGQETVLQLSLDWGLTAYDAVYVAVALEEGAALGTLDKDLLALKGKEKRIQFL
jgi:predicted nucleic acid-binding protein